MENKNCEVICDLIPLYVDDVCSKESKRLVEEHLSECEACRQSFEAMKEDFKMPENKEQCQEDAKVIKRVKKRIWIERIVITVLVLFVTGIVMFGLTLKMTVSHKNMNDVVNLDEVSIEEDSKGNLWLIRSGNATMASLILPEIYTKEGKVVISHSQKIYNKQSKNQSYQMKVIFYESPLIYWIQKWMDMDLGIIKGEKSQLVSKENLGQYEQIVMEQSDGTQKILWEKE